MKVCFFGSYVKSVFDIPSGNGGILLRKILESQNVEVVECHEPIEKISECFRAYWKLFCKHRKINYDILIIPWRGILTLPLAKLIHRKPIVYFPAFSIYDTLVNDRKLIKKGSIKAKFIHWVDKFACKISDEVIVESKAEIDYFANEFNLSKRKFRQLFLSSDESIFVPLEQKEKEQIFQVFFFGSFIPLHGIKTIVEAAKSLQEYKEILFILAGDGQTKPEVEKFVTKNNLDNVKFLGLVPKDILLEKIRSSDVCLGIFGDTEKAKKVLTNKAYQILASKKPLITMESPTAIDARLKTKKNCVLVPPDSSKNLAEAILFLKDNPEEIQNIANQGYQTYLELMSMEIIGKRLVGFIEELLKIK